jgi:hypothetical protein
MRLPWDAAGSAGVSIKYVMQHLFRIIFTIFADQYIAGINK